jgi:hypothetical protein
VNGGAPYQHAVCMCPECVTERSRRVDAAVDLNALARHRALTGLLDEGVRREIETLLEIYVEGRP